MITIFIEGTTAKSNGDLRGAFRQLLSQSGTKQKFEIILGDDKGNTIRKFKLFDRPDNPKSLLVDLDADESKRLPTLQANQLTREANCFFMVEEMEAWFFSQPEVLEAYYGKDLKLGQRGKGDASKIPSPSDVLATLTFKTKKGKYHKVQHACDLIPKLSLTKLQKDFKDVADLVKLLV
jgi:Domain of unknown function (DUF4276)